MTRYRSRIFEMTAAAALTLAVTNGAAAQTTQPMVVVAPAPTPSVQSLHGLNPFQPMQPMQVPHAAPHLQRAQPVQPTQTVPVVKPPLSSVARPSGFAVVLVLGDLKGAAGSDVDVPPAARKALADMKDFLPYKSYQLLDTQWTIGAGQVRSRLRGIENQEYELELDVSRVYETGSDGSPGTRAVERVTFRLREGGATASARFPSAYATQRANKVRAEIGLPPVETPAEELAQRKVLALAGTSETRPLIDTSFPMQVGETVVVGTSRLQGDKALIVVLTAAGR